MYNNSVFRWLIFDLVIAPSSGFADFLRTSAWALLLGGLCLMAITPIMNEGANIQDVLGICLLCGALPTLMILPAEEYSSLNRLAGRCSAVLCISLCMAVAGG